MKSMIGNILAEPETSPSTTTTEPVVTPEVEVAPTTETTPTPATEPTAEGAAPTVPAVEATPATEETSPFDEPEPVAFEAKPAGVEDKTWKAVYPAYQFIQELKKPFEDGGIGHEPTVDDVRQYYDAFADRVAMEEDFASGNGQSAVNFVTKWFGPGADGNTRQNSDFVAGAIPHALARSNPAALGKLVTELTNVLGQVPPETLANLGAAMPAALGNNSDAIGAMAKPIFESYTSELWNRWERETNPQIKESLYQAAQIHTKDLTGQYRMFDNTGKPVEAPVAPKADTSALDAKRAEIEQRERAFNQQKTDFEKARATQWQNQMSADVSSEVEPLYDLALKPLRGTQADGPYNAAKRDFVQEVSQRVQKDPKWPIYKNLVQRAFRTSSPEDATAVVDFYKEMATRAIAAVRSNFLTQWGVAAKKQSDARHAELQRIESKREPSTAGAPTKPVVNGGAMVRQKGETQEDFLKRQIRLAAS